MRPPAENAGTDGLAMPAADTALMVFICFLWGVNMSVIRAGTAEIPPMLLSAMRFACVGLILTPFFRPKRQSLFTLFLLSITLGILHFGLLFWGLTGVDASTGAIALNLGGPFSVLLGMLILKERVGPWRLFGIALAFSGVAILSGEPSHAKIWHLLAMVFAAFMFAVSSLLVKSLKDEHPLTITGWMALFAAPQIAVLSAFLEDDHLMRVQAAGFDGWFALFYTAVIASILAHSLYYRLLRKHEISRVAPYALLMPVFGILGGIMLLGESLSWQKIAGGITVIGGVGLIEWRQAVHRRRQRRTGTQNKADETRADADDRRDPVAQSR